MGRSDAFTQHMRRKFMSIRIRVRARQNSPHAPRLTRDAKQPSGLLPWAFTFDDRRILMSRYMPLSFALASFIALASTSDAFAHCFVGARFFPATLATDDPCVADEMSLPTVQWSKTADMPPATQWDISGDFSKRITENFGVSIGETWTQIRQPDGSVTAGFQNFGTTFQYQLLKDRSHEFALMAGLIVEWGNTGAINSGLGRP